MLITGTDFNDGAINYSTCHFVERERYEQDKHIQIKNGSILITKDGTLGKVAYVQGLSMPATLNVGVFNVEIKDETEVNDKYLFQYLKAPFLMDYVNKKATGGTIKHLNQNILVDFPVVMPSKAEQEEIGRYFDNLDHLITLHQKKCLEWKKRDFTRVSISWEQRKLGEVANLLTGFPFESKKFVREGIKLVRGMNVKRGYLDFSEELCECWSSSQGLDNYLLNSGDILIQMDGALIGKSYAKIKENQLPALLVQRVTRVRIQNQIADESFVYQQIQKGFLSYIKGTKTETAVPHLSLNDIESFEIATPSVDEEKKIGAFFESLDHLITLHQRKLELLKRLRNSLINRCFTGEKYTMSKLILYHGSPNRVIVPKFGFGEDRHDYGRGFYLTENLELAKEWAVCRPDETNGWVHKYELEMDGLNILDFQKYDVLSWLAELMKHRDAADSKRYKMLAQKFIEKYGVDTCGYDVITGWRANASYFYIAKEFVRDNIDIEILEELLSLGGLGIQFCIKSERAFAQLSEVEQDIMSVDYSEFNDRYNERDINARNKMRALVDSDANKVTHVFSTLFER